MNKVKKITAFGLSVLLTVGLVYNSSFSKKIFASGTITVNGTWSDNKWYNKQSDFKPPATMTKSYTDSYGNIYPVYVPLVSGTQIATTIHQLIKVMTTN